MKPAQQITSLSIQPTYLLDPSSGLNSYSLVAWDYQGFHNLVVYTHCTGSRKLNSSSQRYTQPTNFELWFGLYSYHYHLTNFPQTDVTTDTTYRTFDDPGIHHAFTHVSPWSPNRTHPHKDTQGALPLQMGTILRKTKEYSLYNPIRYPYQGQVHGWLCESREYPLQMIYQLYTWLVPLLTHISDTTNCLMPSRLALSFRRVHI